jgi:hypothetical protein
MLKRNQTWQTPSYTSPVRSNRACLCSDEDTYKIECCEGFIINQGIGNINRNS